MWLAVDPVHPQALQWRQRLVWALVAALWLDGVITAVALLFGRHVRELNPVGVALYSDLGLVGLAGLKAWASLVVVFVSQWVRPLRAVKVLGAILGLYGLILIWNSFQLGLAL